MNEQALNLRDIHLPEPISWWPLAPGWWILLAALILLTAGLFVARKIYAGRQLKRDISAELEIIKQQYEQSQNKAQLAKSLSVLLRRASISFYAAHDVAGLTGEHWLAWLDSTNEKSSVNTFQSEAGKILLTAPYLPDHYQLNFDARRLIDLCESWLLSSHKRPTHKKPAQVQPA